MANENLDNLGFGNDKAVQGAREYDLKKEKEGFVAYVCNICIIFCIVLVVFYSLETHSAFPLAESTYTRGRRNGGGKEEATGKVNTLLERQFSIMLANFRLKSGGYHLHAFMNSTEEQNRCVSVFRCTS